MEIYCLYEGDDKVATSLPEALDYLKRYDPDVAGCEEFHVFENDDDDPYFSLPWTGPYYPEDATDALAWKECLEVYRDRMGEFMNRLKALAHPYGFADLEGA